ncbi:hypothetical protein [Candidatus Parabeggiatoa sp. HSG14]|uniref:hypothetical protein n=1 Tax=Candidatus Parabeggiatoa sp. HSG14 TaxID=3055593 RepID=UPI0025A8192C|nr:hypothetical protein [Thiotrichales bacterium HSG14]
MKQTLAFLLTATLCLPVSAAWWIAEISGGDCTITRNAKPLKALQLMALQEGDIIQVGKGSYLQLVKENRQRQKISLENSPFTIPQTPPPSSLIGNLFIILEKWFSQKTGQQVADIDLSSRGSIGKGFGLQGVGDKNYLLSGQKQLHVYWQEGVAPYKLVLKQGDTIIASTNSQQRQAHLSFPALVDGKYELVLEDDYYQRQIIQLEVGRKLPDEARTIQQTDLPVTIKQGYFALALVKQPSWRLQAQQALQKQPALLVEVLNMR